ncbi:SRPBCC domain-containing protein [Herbiconiux sp. UC225_62]|uniref:SRPBCC domain-containing protein n=1 Tax=Herbiconiux sp. UC225_62 TaxID=3350168 RepID=UPI0036D353B9
MRTPMDVQQVLAAIAEPQRYRIVTLLAERPHTVGEVASALSALQPQTTKHLQTLESAGVITVHRLGRRRLAALERDTLRLLAEQLSELGVPRADDAALGDYARAVRAETERAAASGSAVRSISLHRRLTATPEAAWAAWTEPDQARRWWAPNHFTVTEFDLPPAPGATVAVGLREGDGTEYASTGRMLAAEPARLLEFELAPLGPDGAPLFTAVYRAEFATVEPAGSGTAGVGQPGPADVGARGTDLLLTIRVDDAVAEAAPVLAGLELGWANLLDNLAAQLRKGDTAVMEIEQWWPKLSPATREWLADNNGDAVTPEIVAEIERAAGAVDPTAWWFGESDASGFFFSDAGVDWIEAAANGETP